MEYSINPKDLVRFLRNNGLLVVEESTYLNLTKMEQEKKRLLTEPFLTVDKIATYDLVRKSRSTINNWIKTETWKKDRDWFWNKEGTKRLVLMETIKEYRERNNIL